MQQLAPAHIDSPFNFAFPAAGKREDAVSFCRKEILAAVRDNLVEQTPQTLSDPSATSAEDMEAR